jgi:uncharacterized protein
MPKRASRKTNYARGQFALRVGRSRTGKGVFAEEEIPRGRRIIEYIGKPVKEGSQDEKGRYLFWRTKTKMIDGNIKANRARYINHSCKPNCRAEGDGRIFIVSRRRIHVGEELTYHYGKEYFQDIITPKGCRCVKCDPHGRKTARALEKQRARKNGRKRRKTNAKPNGSAS